MSVHTWFENIMTGLGVKVQPAQTSPPGGKPTVAPVVDNKIITSLIDEQELDITIAEIDKREERALAEIDRIDARFFTLFTLYGVGISAALAGMIYAFQSKEVKGVMISLLVVAPAFGSIAALLIALVKYSRPFMVNRLYIEMLLGKYSTFSDAVKTPRKLKENIAINKLHHTILAESQILTRKKMVYSEYRVFGSTFFVSLLLLGIGVFNAKDVDQNKSLSDALVSIKSEINQSRIQMDGYARKDQLSEFSRRLSRIDSILIALEPRNLNDP
jgi:hypothetical protein